CGEWWRGKPSDSARLGGQRHVTGGMFGPCLAGSYAIVGYCRLSLLLLRAAVSGTCWVSAAIGVRIERAKTPHEGHLPAVSGRAGRPVQPHCDRVRPFSDIAAMT